MKVLFTNNHVLNENTIKPNSIIEIQQNNNKYKIKITEDRFSSTNEDLDYTCIQIFDNEPYNNYLIIDNEINNDNAYEKYKDDKFIIIQYIRNEDYPSVDDGEIKKINNNKEIYYNISTLPGSSGSPIINLSRNLNVIGIHCGNVKKEQFKDLCNRGIYFQQILNDIK
jgi:V8-like Glu-specific endopeptidase